MSDPNANYCIGEDEGRPFFLWTDESDLKQIVSGQYDCKHIAIENGKKIARRGEWVMVTDRNGQILFHS